MFLESVQILIPGQTDTGPLIQAWSSDSGWCPCDKDVITIKVFSDLEADSELSQSSGLLMDVSFVGNSLTGKFFWVFLGSFILFFIFKERVHLLIMCLCLRTYLKSFF